MYFGTAHSPSRSLLLPRDFLFHLGLSFVLFLSYHPSSALSALGSRNLFVFVFPQRQKLNKRKQLLEAGTKPLGLGSSAKDEYKLPFVIPHTLLHPPLSTPPKALPHFPSLFILSGPAVDAVSTDFHAYIMLASSLKQFLHPSPGK